MAHIKGASETTWQPGRFEGETEIELLQRLWMERCDPGNMLSLHDHTETGFLNGSCGLFHLYHQISPLICTSRFASVQCLQIGQNFVSAQHSMSQVHLQVVIFLKPKGKWNPLESEAQMLSKSKHNFSLYALATRRLQILQTSGTWWFSAWRFPVTLEESEKQG